MPTKTVFVEPDKFMDIIDKDGKQIPVYHTYKNDDIENNPPHGYSYTFDKRQDGNAVFDIRSFIIEEDSPLGNHPPFINSVEDKAEQDKLKQQWAEWHQPGGGEEQARKAIIQGLWDLGYLKATYAQLSE